MSNRKILYSLFNNAWRMFQTAVKDHNDTSKLFVLAWFQWIRQKPVGWGFCLCSTSKCALCVLVQLLESDLPVASSPPQIDPQSPQNETIQLLIFLCFLFFFRFEEKFETHLSAPFDIPPVEQRHCSLAGWAGQQNYQHFFTKVTENTTLVALLKIKTMVGVNPIWGGGLET